MAKELDVLGGVTEPTADRTTASDCFDRVGYGHPPKHTRFRPGQSGNPSGRPKGRRSFKRDLAAALDAASASAGDRTKQQAIAENLVNDALARDPTAIRTLVPIALALDDDDASRDSGITALEQKLIADFDRRNESKKSRDGSDQ
jgi:hypothetical protein